MTGLLLLFAAALPPSCAAPCQDPAPAASVDVVVLRSGEELRGTLLVDVPGYLEIRVGSDTTVGIERADVAEVRRGVAAAPPSTGAASGGDPATASEPSTTSPGLFLAVRDEWFVLHDGEGRCIGTLHATLRTGEQGELKIAEEWDFATERASTQVTQMETLHRDGMPMACFYHERTQHQGERHPRDERLVRGEYAAGKLRLVRTSTQSEQVEYTIGSGLIFPLALREILRQRPSTLGGTGVRMVYDASRDELAQQAFVANARRRVEVEGKAMDARETRIGSGARTSTEWIDGTGRVLRREVSGPALVAVRCGRDLALAMVASKAKAFPAAVLREAEGRFSLWLPNSIWRFDGEQTAGQVTAQAPLYDASVSALLLDQLAPTAHLGMAGDVVERWLRAVCRDFKTRSRQPIEVRGQAALAVDGSYQRSIGDRVVRCDVSVLVARTPAGAFLALCFASPANDYDSLRPDFDRMVESLELHPAAVAAEASPGKKKIAPR